jgi:putative peptidoglycan binding protein
MKRIVFLTFIGSLALVLTAWGAPRDKQVNRSAKGQSASNGHVVSARSGNHAAKARTSPSVRSRGKTHSVAHASTGRSGRMQAARTRSARTANRSAARKTSARSRTTADREKAVARANTERNNRAEAARNGRARVGQANVQNAAARNLVVNRQRNLTFARNVALNRDRNVRVVNYWRNDRFRGGDYVAFYNYNRVWHDRGWWVSYYPRVVFVLGGWWYWNTGYWYPAWGYDPYAWYSYDGPIYTGYADRTPDGIIEDVQLALQQQGYYAGSIDGLLGPQTRGALAAFQSDYGLAITSAVDRPTLQTLGLT